MKFTEAQQKAIESTGNVVVVAGAGAGKTRTMVERCARAVLEQGLSVRELLVVTFTEAAAAEARERLKKRLEEALQFDPGNEKLSKEIAWLDLAQISTFHSFCYRLVQEHFYRLGIDPGARLLDERQAKLLLADAIDRVILEHYQGERQSSEAVQKLVLDYHGGRDQSLKELVKKLHEFTQTRPDPEGWFAREIEKLSQPAHPAWDLLLREEVRLWAERWLRKIETLPFENTRAHGCADILRKRLGEELFKAPAEILAKDDFPRGTGHFKIPVKKLFEEAAGFQEYAEPPAGSDPLSEDWENYKWPVRQTLELARECETQYAELKRDRGVLDFHDLEQFALQLLWETGAPTEIARSWQQRFKLIFVDEYQDTNGAQEMILRAISHEVPGNRFLVGDIKQSIYGFRQANPEIFKAYIQDAGWQKIDLAENFRSHEAILNFVNGLFSSLMSAETGQLPYDSAAYLKFGEREATALRAKAEERPSVEVQLLVEETETENSSEESSSEDGASGAALAELETTEKEARLVAARVGELCEQYEFYDEKLGRKRRPEFKDIVILLRSPYRQVEPFARAFAAFGIPLETQRNEFFVTPEIFDLINLLTILDNPLQDVPLLAVLHSPLVGLDFEELALIRAAGGRTEYFWECANNFLQAKSVNPETYARLHAFRTRYDRWREVRPHLSLSQMLLQILADTEYESWVMAQPSGRQNAANIQQLVGLAQDFDQLRGEGLYHFLKHVQRLQEGGGDIRPTPAETSSAVRLLSVHGSKGLEFPIVFVSSLGRKFNAQDSQANELIDPELGLCTRIKLAQTTQQYVSLPLRSARRKAAFASVAEEMRLLYVAMTRPTNLLILTGSIAAKKWPAVTEATASQTMECKSWLEWLLPYLKASNPDWATLSEGRGQGWGWRRHEHAPQKPANVEVPSAASGHDLLKLWRELKLKYDFAEATRHAAKSSVSSLRRALIEQDEESQPYTFTLTQHGGVQRGLANHAFLEMLDLNAPLDVVGLKAQAGGFVQCGKLTAETEALLNCEAIARFWASPTGQRFLQNRAELHRELPFTMKLNRGDAAVLRPEWVAAMGGGEFMVVQGIIDLAVVSPQEIWLLDFKTDAIGREGVQPHQTNYAPQLALYARALEKMFGRPVTSRQLHFLSTGETVDI